MPNLILVILIVGGVGKRNLVFANVFLLEKKAATLYIYIQRDPENSIQWYGCDVALFRYALRIKIANI